MVFNSLESEPGRRRARRLVAVSVAMNLGVLAFFPLAANSAATRVGPGAPTPAPTLADVRYGPYRQQLLHFWRAESSKPTPLLFFVHGGAWVAGDRISEIVGLLHPVLDAGISIVSVEYRFIPLAENESLTPPLEAPMHDAARALQFVRSKAGEWNIDKRRVVASGQSAGGCTSLWLAFHDDLADPKSKDPVARESTRLAGAVVMNAQTSLDPKQMREWTPNSFYGAHAFGAPDFETFLARRAELLPVIEKYSPYALVTPDDPPIYLSYEKPPGMGQPRIDPTHTANFGVALQEKLRANGVPCELVYPGAPAVRHATPQEAVRALLLGPGLQ